MLLQSSTIDDLLEAAESFFKRCIRLNVRLNSEKCFLFATSVRWCGRRFDEKRWRLDPRIIDSLRNISAPTTGARLQQFVCAPNLFRTCIASFTLLATLLQDFLEKVNAAANKRARPEVARISIAKLGWGMLEKNSFEDCKCAISKQVTLAHRNPTQRLCLVHQCLR